MSYGALISKAMGMMSKSGGKSGGGMMGGGKGGGGGGGATSDTAAPVGMPSTNPSLQTRADRNWQLSKGQ